MGTGFTFSRFIACMPARSVVDGLRAEERGPPSYEGVVFEHDTYVTALKAAGLSGEILPPRPEFPDSLFVEDTALVFADAAILLRPGAASRFGEAAEMELVLKRLFPRLLALRSGRADGGDILTTPREILIGRSARTSSEGADGVVRLLNDIGRRARVVDTPQGVLHLKSDCALVDEDTVLSTARLAKSGLFAGFKILTVPDGEEAAANALRVNNKMFVAQGFPRTRDLLERSGCETVPLPVREISKIDAGLSCMSLRW